MKSEGVLATPRPVPDRMLPAVGGTIVVGLALPLFFAAGWRIGAWALAAVLWVVFQGIGLLLQRLPLGMGNLASAGVVAFGRMFRAAGLVAILIAVAVSSSGLGLPAAIVYAAAFTVEFVLSLIMYFGGEAST
ncbi:MAG: hypothetical protein WCH31_04530 [Actinomycetes bacterium]